MQQTTSAFIDIHHHIVYGVDDGPSTFEESIDMMHAAVNDGIRVAIATSHALPSFQSFPKERYYRHLRRQNDYCIQNNLPLRLYDGCEVFFSAIAVRQLEERRLPTLANSRFVLIEFDPTTKAEQIVDALRQISNLGLIPIVAHVERYRAIQCEPCMLLPYRSQFPFRLQMNCDTVTAKHPRGLCRLKEKLLSAGLVDYIGSDAHNASSRCTGIQSAYLALTKEYGLPRSLQYVYRNQLEIFDRRFELQV